MMVSKKIFKDNKPTALYTIKLSNDYLYAKVSNFVSDPFDNDIVNDVTNILMSNVVRFISTFGTFGLSEDKLYKLFKDNIIIGVDYDLTRTRLGTSLISPFENMETIIEEMYKIVIEFMKDIETIYGVKPFIIGEIDLLDDKNYYPYDNMLYIYNVINNNHIILVEV